MRSPKHFTSSIPVRIVRKVCPPRIIDWYALYALTWRPRRAKSLAKMSPGVATPCPAAPPIATAKVRSMLVSFRREKRKWRFLTIGRLGYQFPQQHNDQTRHRHETH